MGLALMFFRVCVTLFSLFVGRSRSSGLYALDLETDYS